MGGAAFGSGPNAPDTPRMPPAVYCQVRAECHAALRELFVYVATPIEGPAKKDHGDLDVLVAVERRLAFPRTPEDAVQTAPLELMEAIKGALHAIHAIVTPSATSANLAIPWPADSNQDPARDGERADLDGSPSDAGARKRRCIQVDVRICKDVDQLSWHLFKHAHGDIWNLLGSTIRPLGLTADEDALWLRIPEIEKLDRKKSKVMLSQDPVDVVHFLGLKVEGFWADPFPSINALFDYVTTSRLFWVKRATDEEGYGDGDGDGEGADNEGAAGGVTGGQEGRKKLRSNDRRRMKGRPIYRQWINEFIPRLQAQGRFVHPDPDASIAQLRAQVRDDAFTRFFVEPEYRGRLREWRVKRGIEEVKGLIKSSIPDLDPQYRACLVTAMKKIILEDDLSFDVTPPPSLKDPDGVYDIEATRAFLMQNWQGVGERAWSKQKQKARENMVVKQLKRKAPQELETPT